MKEKYTTTTEFYNAKVVHDIMYNETVQIVSIFKDYLILDDLTEFLKRPYSIEESKQKLPKMIKFYESYSNSIPNYANLPENKFIFKNIAKKQKAAEEKHRYLLIQKSQKKPSEAEHAKMMSSIMSEERLFDQKFIEEVKNQKYLKDKKNYKRMKLSGILDSFLQNSSVMINTSQQSNMKETTGSIFSKVNESSRIIPEKTLKILEKEPDLKFSAQVLHQRMYNKLATDPETKKVLILNIQRKLLDKRRKDIAKAKAEKRESRKKAQDKKIIIKSSKEKLFQKGGKRISIDDRDRFIQTISKIKTRNANLTQ